MFLICSSLDLFISSSLHIFHLIIGPHGCGVKQIASR